MTETPNPYQTPVSEPSRAEAAGREGPIYRWQGRQFEIRARFLRSSGYFVGEHTVILDETQEFRNASLRFHERIDFSFVHEGRIVVGLYQTYGWNFGDEAFRLIVDGETVASSRIRAEKSRQNLIAQVILGFVIGGLGSMIVIAWLLFT